jgi:putative ABC transport system permease protein
VAVLSRVLRVALRPLRAMSRSWPTALYLAVRRVARYRVAVLGLVAAAAVAAGVLGYAATMNRSLAATLEAKAATFVGSDMAVRIAADQQLPSELADRATHMQVHTSAWLDAGNGQESVVVRIIDPATFEGVAFWDASFADSSLRHLTDLLARPAEGGPVPALVVGMEIHGTAEAEVSSRAPTSFRIEQVADVRAFPGMAKAKPTVYVAARAVEDLQLGHGRSETWIRGDRGSIVEVLEASGTGFGELRMQEAVAGRSSFLTVSWTFGFMQSLGVSAGILVLGGVAVYLDARRRDRLLGYTFMRRMGLTGGQHRRALVVELTASVLVGCWTGLGISVVAAWLAHQRIDPVPGFEPDPLLRPAGGLIVALALASLALAAVAAVLAQRGIDRDDPVEVLRAGI